MKQNRKTLGAFWIEGTEKYFFGLRDAKNYQLIKGGNILGPHQNLLYPDPFPSASACSDCGNKITPTGAFAGVEMSDLPTKCSDCGGKVKRKAEHPGNTEMDKSDKKGFFSFFRRS